MRGSRIRRKGFVSAPAMKGSVLRVGVGQDPRFARYADGGLLAGHSCSGGCTKRAEFASRGEQRVGDSEVV
jgi:hypothetical protein